MGTSIGREPLCGFLMGDSLSICKASATRLAKPVWRRVILPLVALDNSEFPLVPHGQLATRNPTMVGMKDLDGHKDDFIFSACCCESLERLSIQRAEWYSFFHVSRELRSNYVPQNALIKFVRNAPPSLRWFRSDLSKENINILQREHPGVEFLN